MFPRLLLAAVSLAMAAATSAAAATPPAAKADTEIVDDISYSQDQARRIWQPMEGSKPVSVVDLDGRKALKMPCNFKGTAIERASWDRDLKLDLSGRKGIGFLMYCRNPMPVSHFSLYLRSGNGWYAAGFSPSAGDRWVPVEIRKWSTRVEGTPAGWSRIDGIRVSAWRGRDEDTEFHIAALGMLGRPADAKIAVIRPEAGTDQQEAKTIADCTERMSQALERLGQEHAILSDRDVTPERLKGKQIAILPFCPGLSEGVTGVLAAFVKGGGKLLAFYVLPGGLQEAGGIRLGAHMREKHPGQFASIRASDHPLAGAPPSVGQASWNILHAEPVEGAGRVAAWWYDDKGQSTGEAAVVATGNCVFMTHILLSDDPQAKGQLLMAMLGHLVPDIWSQAAAARLSGLGRFGPYDGFDAAMKGLRAQAEGGPGVPELLARIQGLHDRAGKLRGEGEFPQAVAAAEQAHKMMIEAYCRVQQPRAGEHRAFWCHSAFGVAGMTWDQAIKLLADNGFTAILPNMLWGGVAFYASDVLPVAPEVKDKGDQIALCAAACKKYGVACHVWKVNYNMGWRAPKDFMARMKAQGRTQVEIGPKPDDRWLCPSHPENQKLEIESMVEVARKYDVAGIHFDYIRYPHAGACYCDGCRERFEKYVGHKVDKWNADLRKDRALYAKWLDFRRQQITTVVAAVAERARKIKPGLKISAAVFRSWPSDRDSVGQDWKLWCDKGYLDFVCPMDYTPDTWGFQRMVTDQLIWAGKVPCYPGIGVSCWPDPTDVVKLIDQINVTRRLKTGGFTIFNYSNIEAANVVPLCGLGITRKK